MKKFLIIIILLFSVCVYGDEVIEVTLPANSPEIVTETPETKEKIIDPDTVPCKAILLMDMKTCEVLYGKKIYYPFPNASTTKIMTAIMACKYLKPDIMLTVSQNAAKTPYNSMGFIEGEQISMSDCVGAMLVRSANDTAVVLAENISGSVGDFMALVNREMYNLGCLNSHFVTPNGLHDPKHHTTCYDLAKITMAAQKYPLIVEFMNTKSFQITSRTNPKGLTNIKSSNKFTLNYPYATGAKSGFTTPAGNCMVCTASRDGRDLLLVILNVKKNIYDYLPGVMNWGFKKLKG